MVAESAKLIERNDSVTLGPPAEAMVAEEKKKVTLHYDTNKNKKKRDNANRKHK